MKDSRFVRWTPAGMATMEPADRWTFDCRAWFRPSLSVAHTACPPECETTVEPNCVTDDRAREVAVSMREVRLHSPNVPPQNATRYL